MDIANNLAKAKKPRKYMDIRARISEKLRADIKAWKLQHKCARCPENDPVCLDLHHLDPAEKDFTPSSASSFPKFLEEAKKCIILCANCHRKEHHND
jgi:hypothetical protein